MLGKQAIYLFEPHKLEVILIWLTDEEIKKLDDEENYVIINPERKQCFVNGEWINIPEGRIQSSGQLVVVNAG